MAERRFKPLLWPTIMAVPALALLLGLGTWQVQRHFWKQDLIETRTSRAAAEAVDAPGAEIDIADFEFRRVRATGVFMHDREMYLGARSLHSNVGYHVVTPLRRADGAIVLVDRGWVPLDGKDPATRLAGQIPGDVALEGIVRAPGRKSSFTPDNRPDRNFWFYIDIPAMAEHAGLSNVLPYIIEAGAAENPGGMPIGGQTRLEIRNEHLQYVFIWYSLAIALVVIYILFHRRPRP